MQKVTKQELLTLAHLSRLQLFEDEIPSLINQINDVLTYALRVKDLVNAASLHDLPSQKNRNVFRDDVVVKTNPEPILHQAPESEQHYFVVPVILETT